MNSDTANQEKQYFGLIGLDKLPLVVKTINFCISTVIGINLAFDSWYSHFYRGIPSYISPPFLPLIFAWPLCGIMLWLRLTGIKWVWCLLASGIILVGYYMLQVLALAIGQFIS